MPIRIDSARLDKGEMTSQGFLRAPAFFTRTGVFTYRRQDGSIVRELRHPDDVFHPDSIASLQMAPLTDDHPEEMVTPENVKELSVGWIGEGVKQDGERLAGSAVVADARSIKRVQTGKVELSCGYDAQMVKESGVYNGERYDERQTNIRYNHVAIVSRGRAGRGIRLRLDSEDAILDDGKPQEQEMKKIRIDGKDYEVSQEVYDAYMAEKTKTDAALADEKKRADDATKRADDAETALKSEKSRADKAEGRADAAEEKLSKRNDSADPKSIDRAVAERMAIAKTANVVMGKDFKLDGKDNLTVMREVVTKHSPKTSLEGKSDEYVKARFDSIAEEVEGREERRTQIPPHRPNDKRKDEEFDAKAARERQSKADAERWKEPLSASKK
jgi:hypothetical protein